LSSSCITFGWPAFSLWSSSSILCPFCFYWPHRWLIQMCFRSTGQFSSLAYATDTLFLFPFFPICLIVGFSLLRILSNVPFSKRCHCTSYPRSDAIPWHPSPTLPPAVYWQYWGLNTGFHAY
jgi:hypothetical protein